MIGTPSDYWGKLEQDDNKKPVAWHPLVCHCADVAMVTKALLERSLIGQRLATLCKQKALSPTQIERMSVLAALHDFGKTNHGFQAKRPMQNKLIKLASEAPCWLGARRENTGRIRPTSNNASKDGSGVND